MSLEPTSRLLADQAVADHFNVLLAKAPAQTADLAAHAAFVRGKVRMACPKCFSAEQLEVTAECRCKLDERGRAWPTGNFDGSFNGDSACSCGCGWRGDVAEAQDAFSECCTSCCATPDNITTNDAADGRYCTECRGEDI